MGEKGTERVTVSKNGEKETVTMMNSRISIMGSAVPDAPLMIVMFLMFVVNGAATPEGPRTYRKPV